MSRSVILSEAKNLIRQKEAVKSRGIKRDSSLRYATFRMTRCFVTKLKGHKWNTLTCSQYFVRECLLNKKYVCTTPVNKGYARKIKTTR